MPPMNDLKTFDLDKARERISREDGTRLWRSLRELADAEGFRRHLQSAFPELARWTESMDRRSVLRLIGASMALAGMSACTGRPPESIVPYVHEPEGVIPGNPAYYATAMPVNGYGKGVLVESHMGRPTKVEGNPQHPASLGATDPFAQASILSLYDPDRSQSVTFQGRPGSWTAFLSALNSALEEQSRKKGAGLRIITGTITSPTFVAQMQSFLQKFPEAKWHQYEPDNTDGARAGSQMAFGQNVHTYFRISAADVILSLDSDFLTHGPAWLRYSNEWAERRRHDSAAKPMNRLYAAESTPTCTGAVADHRIPMRAIEIEAFGREVARALGMSIPASLTQVPVDTTLVKKIAGELQQHRGTSLVVPGEYQPGSVHAMAHAVNGFLMNTGETVIHTDSVEANPVNHMQSLRELTEMMNSGKVDLLLVLGANPAFTAPADINFLGAMNKVRLAIHLGMHFDETAAMCQWHIPESHYLESWSDIRAFDGTCSIIQPLIAPLYDTYTAHEVLAIMHGMPQSGLEIVRAYWRSQHRGNDFDSFWQSSLRTGVIPNTAFPPKLLTANLNAPAARGTSGDRNGTEIIFRPDPSISDGRFANNGWLQELPKPLTKITWENAVLMGPETARRFGLKPEELPETEAKGTPAPMVELRYSGRSVQAPSYVMPGHPENCITVHYGYGRKRGGKIAVGRGFNGYALRRSDEPSFGSGVEVRPLKKMGILATTQSHFTMSGRDPVRTVTRHELNRSPDLIEENKKETSLYETLYGPKEWQYREYKWAMTVDLSRCIGCNSCVVACQSENNTPVLGKEQVGRQREMHWLRIDRYFAGSPERPATYFQPVFCMHCELAPCELVCPTHATNHSSEGINQMVYNRCVGTRFCSHNCPYKVRRFNFLQYSDYVTPSKEPLHNPDVTVRARGVMEKCTYCIQRIQEAKITASKENRSVRDGEIMTACQQACPTRVFTFGNLNDSKSAVYRSSADPLNYGLLAELNTRPRTTYLAAMRNPHPESGKGEGNE